MALITGNSGDNYLDGTVGDDTIYGYDGNDTLVGNGGTDSLIGGNGDDRYWVKDAGDLVVESANSGYDAVWSEISYTLTANVEELDLLGTADINGTGNSLDNWMFDNAGNNVLSGLDGNDTLVSSAGGIDTLIGGNGDDVYWINNASTVVVETNASDAGGWDNVWSSVSYTLPTNVEELDLLGTANINATGNSGINYLYGNSGDNYLNGLAGDDTLIGNAGNDTLQGGGGADSMAGGTGDDYYYVDNAGDVVTEAANEGYDKVASSISYTLTANVEELDLIGSANINATGNSLDNYIYGNSGNNVLSGMDGNDTLDATAGGTDTLIGGNGDDVYWINNASDTIIETNASDAGGWDDVWSSVSYTLPTNVEELDLLGTANINATGNSGVNYLYGNSGNNYLNGLSGNDSLVGNAGNDTLQGGGGGDTMWGGSGNDVYYVDNVGDSVYEYTTPGVDDGGYDKVISSISYTLPTYVEELDLIGSANINATGNSLDNYIYGNSGNNVLSGMDGNDTLDATAGGTDTLMGGNGDDVYWINNASDVIVETNASDAGGWDDVWSSVSYTLPTNVEELDLLGTANINATGNSGINYLYGNSGNNYLNGLAGDDTLIGNAGNDTLQGGGGADSMVGGDGSDYYYVDNAGDVVVEDAAGTGWDQVESSITYTLTANVEELDLLGTANINATGNSEDNYIYGNSGNNVLSGMDGNDTLDATAGGTDTLIGGNGDDVYWINNASDVITETNASDAGGWDDVWSSVTYTLPTNVEELDLLGSANINATGNSGDNYLYGNAGNNVLTGLGGNDTLVGNGGADSFMFSAAGSANGVDFIQDFVHGTDQLVFASADYGFAAGHNLSASEFTVGSTAVGSAAQFVWNAATHTLYFDHDGAGGDAAIAIATFDPTATLTSSDFHFV